MNEVKTSLIRTRRIVFTPAQEVKDELRNTSVIITCYDREGNEIKRVTSADEGIVEDNGDNGQQTGDNTGDNGQQTGDNTGGNGQQTGDNSGDNQGGGVAGKHLVEVRMVQLRLDALLDEFEVGDHPVLVEFLGFAVDRDGPVMAMQIAALARVGELQMVAGRNHHSFTDIVHDAKFFCKGTKKRAQYKRKTRFSFYCRAQK